MDFAKALHDVEKLYEGGVGPKLWGFGVLQLGVQGMRAFFFLGSRGAAH